MNAETLRNDLRELKLNGMLEALEVQISTPDTEAMSFIDRLRLLLDNERTHRSTKRLKSRLRNAGLKAPHARIEEVSFGQARGLPKSRIMAFANCEWVINHQNITLIGPTGTGKTYLACALAERACRLGFHSRYFRLSKLLHQLCIAKADGSYSKLTAKLNKTDVLILDDWGMTKLEEQERQEFLELIDDRHKTKSTIITSQIPIENWYHLIGEDTTADAIMDRIVSTSHNIVFKGKSMRVEKGLTKKSSEDT